MSNQSLVLRVQQILLGSEEDRKTFGQAIEQALREKFKGPKQFEELMHACIRFFADGNRGLAKLVKESTTRLPEPRQGEFYYGGVPEIIYVEADGGTIIRKDSATVGEIREWGRWALQIHSVQRMRFERFNKELETINDISDGIPWTDGCEILRNRYKQIKQEASA